MTPEQRARARALLSGARDYLGGQAVDFLRFDPVVLVADGWDQRVAACLAQAPDLLEVALARIGDLEDDRDNAYQRADDMEAQLRSAIDAGEAPIPMRLPCPACGQLHVDEGDFATKPHHTHACQHCGMVWRPAVVATVGVRFLPGYRNEKLPESISATGFVSVSASAMPHAPHCHPAPEPPHRCICGALPEDA